MYTLIRNTLINEKSKKKLTYEYKYTYLHVRNPYLRTYVIRIYVCIQQQQQQQKELIPLLQIRQNIYIKKKLRSTK